MDTLPATHPTEPSLERRLAAYADVLLRVGVNLQPSQSLMIRAQVEAAPLVRLLAERAYGLGAPQVEVLWSDEAVTRSRFLHAPDGTFERIPHWRAEGMTAMVRAGFASLTIVSDDPSLLAEADPKRYATYVRTWQAALGAYRASTMSNGVQWCVAAFAGEAWASKLFQGVPGEEAVLRLWDVIFATTRCSEHDPVGAWEAHVARLQAWKDRLNERRYVALHFRGPGTGLRVGLAHGHVWAGASASTPNGVRFVPNLPTEEVFTAPHRDQVDGTVRASLPLVNGGTTIRGIALRFRSGRVVEADATSGLEALRRILDTDEGASRLGEVALVPVSSPVKAAGMLFYATLFDENAASHLALGRAYPTTVRGGTTMSSERSLAAGLNDSLAHVDFMIGSEEVDVDGETADGEREPVMVGGEWTSWGV